MFIFNVLLLIDFIICLYLYKNSLLKSVGYVKQYYKIFDLGNRKQLIDYLNIQYCIMYFDIGFVVNVVRFVVLLI